MGTTAFNNITLNASALTDLKNLDEFKLAIVDYDYDYTNTTIANSATTRSGMRLVSASAALRPYITYTLSTGYGNNVNGVASANIGKVLGVATANIDKINGV